MYMYTKIGKKELFSHLCNKRWESNGFFHYQDLRFLRGPRQPSC